MVPPCGAAPGAGILDEAVKRNMAMFTDAMKMWPGFGALMTTLAVATVIIELALAVGMFFPRWHRWLIPLAVVFHGTLYFAVPVVTFTATMILLLLAFVPAERVHQAIDRLLAGPAPRTMPP